MKNSLIVFLVFVMAGCSWPDDDSASTAIGGSGSGNGGQMGNLPGSVQYGEPCAGDVDCASSVCISLPDGRSLCSVECDSDESCPDDDECVPGDGPMGPTNYCVPGRFFES